MTIEASSVFGGPFGIRSVVPFQSVSDLVIEERSDLSCVFVNAAVDAGPVADRIFASTGVRIPLRSRQVVRNADGTALWLSPRSWLVHCEREREASIVSSIAGEFPQKEVHAIPYTDNVVWLTLSGSTAEQVLRSGGFISLAQSVLGIDEVKRTLVGGIPAVVLRERGDAWTIAVERSRARYFLSWLKRNEISSS